ncbi:MAG: hypothetical protein PUC55_01545 [Lachnospiraceae bacterium]|nr:hypothetical protein [Lachnospiraceae bacterium]
MRVVNIGVYVVILAGIVLWYLDHKKVWENPVGKGIAAYPVLLGILFIANSASFVMTFVENREEQRIMRQGYAGDEISVTVRLERDDVTEEYRLPVRPRQYDSKETRQLMEQAFEELQAHMKGENSSYERISTDLNLELDYEQYPFDVSVEPEDYSLVDETGRIHNSEEELEASGFDQKEIEQGISTAVKITLSYGEITQDRTYPLTIVLQEQEPVERTFAAAKKKLTTLEQQKAGEESFELPDMVEGVRVMRTNDRGIGPLQILLFGGLLMGFAVVWDKEQKRQQIRRRQQQLLRSYPWFVNEMVLMLGAGMQVRHIFSQMLSEYQNMQTEDDRIPLIKELMVADQAFHLGMPEEQIYYQLGRRLGLSCYTKLMTLLEQNVVKGSRGLKDIFEQEEQAALEERKNLAKKLGEEAGTKLLGPMIVLLLIVMFMILVPAFMSF